MKQFFLLPLLAVILLQPVVAQQLRQVQPFDELTVSGKLEVVLQQGDAETVSIETFGIEPDDVDVTQRGGSLRVSLLKSLWRDEHSAKIVITYRELYDLKIIAGAILTAEQPLSGDKLHIRCASGAQANLQVQAKSLEVSASEGGILVLEGSVDRQEASANTGGQLEAEGLEARHTHVRATTGGHARVVAREHLDAAANTGGRVDYIGDPAERYTRSILSGEINQVGVN